MNAASAVKFLDRNKKDKYTYKDFTLTFDGVWKLGQGEHIWLFENTADLVNIMIRIAPLEEWF